MRGTRFVAVCVPGGTASEVLALENLAKTAYQETKGKVMVINLDPAFTPYHAPFKGKKSDLGKLPTLRTWGEIPYLPPEAIKAFTAAPEKKKAYPELGGYHVLVICTADSLKRIFKAVDQLAFLLPYGSSSGSSLFPVLKSLGMDIAARPIGIAILGEGRIELAARAFISLLKEIRDTLGLEPAASFLGCLDFDPDCLSISAACGLPFVDAFPGQTAHGEAKSICRRLLTEDESRDASEIGSILGALAEEIDAGSVRKGE